MKYSLQSLYASIQTEIKWYIRLIGQKNYTVF